MYNNLNSWELKKDNYLFYDMFCRNNELILIIPLIDGRYYINMNVYYNNTILNITNIYDNISNDIVILVYNLNNYNNEDIINIIVEYNNIIKNYKLKYMNILEQKYKLTQTTLFKNDHYLLNTFIKYYEQQGIEHFYLYYNGIIDTTLFKDILLKENITLIEWNFPYIINNKYCSQLMQLNHALYKYGKPYSKFMLFNDLDEYLYIENSKINLSTLVDKYNYYDTIVFLNNWCDTINEINNYQEFFNNYQDFYLNGFPKTFYRSNEINKYGRRSKCIHNTTSIFAIINMHIGEFYYNYNVNTLIDINNIMFHFYLWSGTERTKNFEEYKDYRLFTILDR